MTTPSLTLNQALQQAIQHHQAGQLPEAEHLYRAILRSVPQHADANHNLGILALNVDNPNAALPFLKQALESNPQHAQFWRSYIAGLMQAEQFSLARAVLKQGQRHLINADPLASFKHYLSEPQPQEIATITACFNQGDYATVELLARQLIQEFPADGFSYKALAAVLQRQNRLAESLAIAKTAVALLAKDVEANYNFAVALKEQGDVAQAEHYCRVAIRLQKNYCPAHYTLGIVLQAQQRFAEATLAFQQAIALNPTDIEVYNNLGLLFTLQSRIAEAENCYRNALAVKPDDLDAHNNLGMLLQYQGRLTEAETCYRAALAIRNEAIVYSNLLYLHHYSQTQSATAHLQEAKRYGAMVAQKVPQKFTTWSAAASPQTLRVGLVSSDFREHVVSYFLRSWLKYITPQRIEWFAYPSQSQADEVTEALKTYFTHWTSIAGLSDAAAAQLIYQDNLHILFDLSGHTANNRLPVFAFKPAPLQISWLGYWATTGVAEMDYVLVDEISVPEQAKSHFSEKVCYLPDTRLCFTAPPFEIAVTPLPALTNGFITFGCFQNLSKVTEQVLRAWANILTQLPQARLRFQAKQLYEKAFAVQFYQRLARLGIDTQRVELHPLNQRENYLQAYQQVDFILDSFPFSGGTTTCEALWMGVPTLTLAGKSLIARQGASLLTAAGLPDWVVNNPEDYIAQAVKLAQQTDYLAALRCRLRKQVLASPLFDGARFAGNFENTLWTLWDDYSHC